MILLTVIIGNFGGMQQIHFFMSDSSKPKLLVLDEPFAALDAFTREELWCV